MIRGLNAAEEAAYLAALNTTSARTRTRVHVLDLDHKHQGTFTNDLVEGQVQFNRKADVERSATLTLVDLTDDLADLDLRHLVRAEHGVDVEGHGWLWVPVVTGRVLATTDDGDTATLTVHGKESFGLDAGAPIRTWREGRTIAGAIQATFEDLGETRFRISKKLRREGPELSHDVHTGGPEEKKAPMRVWRRVCRKRGLQVFYDAEGYLVVRQDPDEPAVAWSDDDADDPGTGALGSAQTSPIRWERDLRGIRNFVVAKGKKDLRAVADADELYPGHVYAPSSLERGGVPGRLRHYLVDEGISRQKELRDAAESTLRRLLTERAHVRLECVPTFHIGPHDLARAIRRDGRWADFHIDEASIPLTGEGDMTVGYQQPLRRPRRGRRARAGQ